MKKIGVNVKNKIEFNALVEHMQLKGFESYDKKDWIKDNYADKVHDFPKTVLLYGNNYSSQFNIKHISFEEFCLISDCNFKPYREIQSIGAKITDESVTFSNPIDNLSPSELIELYELYKELQ